MSDEKGPDDINAACLFSVGGLLWVLTLSLLLDFELSP